MTVKEITEQFPAASVAVNKSLKQPLNKQMAYKDKDIRKKLLPYLQKKHHTTSRILEEVAYGAYRADVVHLGAWETHIYEIKSYSDSMGRFFNSQVRKLDEALGVYSGVKVYLVIPRIQHDKAVRYIKKFAGKDHNFELNLVTYGDRLGFKFDWRYDD